MSGVRTRASSRASAFADERSRVPGANGNLRRSAADAKNAEAGPFGNNESHKRSSPAGNARAASRAKDERRYEERKVTERTFEAHVERVISRTNSPAKQQQQQQQPQRRSTLQQQQQQPPEKRPPEMRRQKSSTDLRQREMRAETPPGMAYLSFSDGNKMGDEMIYMLDILFFPFSLLSYGELTLVMTSYLEPRGNASAAHFCRPGIANLDSSHCVRDSVCATAETSERVNAGGSGGCHCGRSVICFHGL